MKTSAILSVIAVALTLNLNAANRNAESGKKTNLKATAALLASPYVEEVLKISAWMLDVDVFEDRCEIREIEDWMVDPAAFGLGNKTLVLDERIFKDYEEKIFPIEDWMFNF